MSEQAVLQNANAEAQPKRAMGVFPRLSLNKVLEFVEVIYEIGNGDEVRRLRVFDKMGKSPESSVSRTLVTVSNGGYGLTTGGYKADFLGITERGQQIVNPPDQVSKLKAIYEALYENKIFAAFMSNYVNRPLPDDEIAVIYLKKNHGLSEADAKAFWEIIKENVRDFGLVEILSGKPVIVARQVALERSQAASPKPSSHIVDNSPQSSVGAPNPLMEKSITPHAPRKIEPQLHFNIQIQLPDNASPETYDAIFRSMAKYLLGNNED